MFRLQRFLPASDLGHDGGSLGGPDEWLGVIVVLSEVALHGDLQVGDALENAAADALAGDLGEEALDEIEPRRPGGGEVEPEPGVLRQPFFTSGCL